MRRETDWASLKLIYNSLNPAAPFVMVGIMELLLVPVYYVGMKRYQQALI